MARDAKTRGNGSTPGLTTPSPFSRLEILQSLLLREPETSSVEEPSRAQKAQLVRRLVAELGPRYAPGRATLDAYRCPHPGQAELIKRLWQIAAELPQWVQAGSGLVWYGPCGTGKDHLASALLYIAAGRHGLSASWVCGMELFGRFRDNIDQQRTEQAEIERLSRPDILCLSDPVPPVGDASAWNLTLLYRVLDRRAHLLRPTWATVNAASPAELEAKLSEPVWDRLKHGAELLPFFWPSYRVSRCGA